MQAPGVIAERRGVLATRRVVDSPVGRLWLAASDAGVCAVQFMEPGEDAPARYRAWVGRVAGVADEASPKVGPAWGHLGAVERELAEYFAGRRREFSVALDLRGTEFQVRAWEALRAIPFGETRSYGGQARMLGDAKATRAVGAANGANPVAIVVPCHRVVASGGGLGGFGGGLARKSWLLEHEERVVGGRLV